MGATSVSFLLILLVGVTRYSVGAPLGKEVLRDRIKEFFRRMAYLCEYQQPKLNDLAYETKRAFAKKYFGDPLEARPVNIKGVELLDNRKRLPLHVFASKAYKQVAIFHSVFQDITQNWSQSQREHKEIKDNLRGIQGRLQHLKKLMEKVVRLSSQSPGNSSLPQVPQPNKKIWSDSIHRQKAWILGVLGEFKLSLIYLRPAIRKRACKTCKVN
nr:uncharacterized protein LOC131782633 [Pocillopora verrucosa]